MQPIHIEAKTISDAWFQLLYSILDKGYKQNIQQGSFEKEQYRLQYPGASVYIEYPDLDMIPIVPEGIPAPTTMDYINNYFINYLMDPALGENETYKYASRIHHQFQSAKDEAFLKGFAAPKELKNKTQFNRVVDMLKKTPQTNQATIEIGTPEDLDICYGNDGKLDPPCLRLIDFKVLPGGKLSVSVFFRSWDLWAGFPSNLGGIELLKQYVAQEAGLDNGPMYAYSSGLHIYGYQEEIVKSRLRR